MSDLGGVDEILSGEDALVATADLLYNKLRTDPRAESQFENVDLAKLALGLRQLLTPTFETEDWPTIHVSPALIEDCYDDFANVMLEAIQESSAGGGDLDTLTADKKEDPRMIHVFETIRGAVGEEDAAEGEEELAEEEAEEEAAEGEEGEAAAAVDEEAEKAAKEAQKAAGTDINVNSFEELIVDDNKIQAANDAWRLFISTAESREAAGEAIYAALFESAPSLQSLFVTPRAVQAMRFMNGLATFVQALTDPAGLKILVETLAFGHLHLDVTVPRVIIFRDAIVDLLAVELAERFNSAARDAWVKLLNYVGGAIIYVRVNYATRITTLLKSWKQANHGDSEKDGENAGDATSSAEEDSAKKAAAAKAAAGKKPSKWKSMFKKGGDDQAGAGQGGKEGEGEHAGKGGNKSNQMSAQNVPTTYPEMFLFNAAVMGFGTSNVWMSEVLSCFDNIVRNVANSARLQEECDVLALRIAKVVKGNVNLPEYKSCMLASLRSLLPKDWDSAHEVAWTWLWENVERLILKVHGKPPAWEKALGKLLGGLDEDQKYEIRKDIYSYFFTAAPAGQDFFKQSNTYLHVVADKIMNMTLDLYMYPVKMVDDISALGLRHVGYAVPTELFGAFVTACVEVLMTRTSDETTIEAFRWSLGLVSKMLVRTITEGSTIVMKAINANSVKLLKKAVSCAPRGSRADWMLTVQVGTQSISPFSWAVESGNLQAARAIIGDLLTFRADRDRYYYGVDNLFTRHPDVIKKLCDQAMDLLPVLLDGLTWRARTAEAGLRRVNYYVKHLLMDEDHNFSKTLSWVANTRDPKLVCHPVIVLVSDLVWMKVAYISFLYGKSWLFFNLVVFVLSQSVLEHLNDGENGEIERTMVFSCRIFIYALSMTRLLYRHCRDCFKAYRTKNTFKLFKIPIPRYLRQWQDTASFFLTVALVAMCCLEPIFWCWPHQNNKLFLETCEEKADMRYPYTVASMFAMFLYYVLLLDLAVISTRISAFVLVCVRMLSEVALFLMALFITVLTFSSAISVLKHDSDQFAGIHVGAYALLRMFLGTFAPERYTEFRKEPAILVVVCVYLLSIVIFLLNMLIAQLSCAYSAVYADMVGYARLDRAETIVEIMPSVPKSRWIKFIDSLRLNKRLEFMPGDIGVAGGIQLKEPASANPTTVDQIRRFGGSTSPEIQWPEDEADADFGDDRFERMEKLIQRTLQRVTKTGGKGTHSGGGSSQGMSGTKQSGSDNSGGSSAGGHDED